MVDIYKNTEESLQVLTLVSKNSVTYCKRISQSSTLAVLDGKRKEIFYLKRVARSSYNVDVLVHPDVYIGNIDNLASSLANGLYKQRRPVRNTGENGEIIYKFDDNEITVTKQMVTCTIQLSEEVTLKAFLVAFGIYCSMIQHGPYVDPTEDNIISNQIKTTYNHELDVSRFSDFENNKCVKKTDQSELKSDVFSGMSEAVLKAVGKFNEASTHTGYSIMDKTNSEIILFLTFVYVDHLDRWLLAQDVNGKEQFRAHFKDENTTVYDGSAIIGRTRYRRNIGQVTRMNIRVYSNDEMQNQFRGTFDGNEYQLFVEDSENTVIASLLAPASASAKFMISKELTTNEKKTVLSQIVKTCFYCFRMDQHLPLAQAVTQSPYIDSRVKDETRTVDYQQVLTRLSQDHVLWPVGCNREKLVYFNLVSAKCESAAEKTTSILKETIFTFECVFENDTKTIDTATLKTSFGEDIIYIKRREDGSATVLTSQNVTIANIYKNSCYNASSEEIMSVSIAEDKTTKKKKEIFFLKFTNPHFTVKEVKFDPYLRVRYESYKNLTSITSDHWAIAIAYALIISCDKFNLDVQSLPIISYYYAKKH